MSWPIESRQERMARIIEDAERDIERLGHSVGWWYSPRDGNLRALENWCCRCGEYTTVEPFARGRAETRGVTLTTRCEDLRKNNLKAGGDLW